MGVKEERRKRNKKVTPKKKKSDEMFADEFEEVQLTAMLSMLMSNRPSRYVSTATVAK